MWLRVAEFTFITLVLIVLITQIIIPLVKGQRTFPTFRTQGKLESKLAEATQEEEEEKVLDKIVTKMSHPPKKQPSTKTKPKGKG